MKSSTFLVSTLALVLGLTVSYQPVYAGFLDGITDEIENQVPDIGIDADDVIKGATDNKAASSLDVRSITFFEDKGIAEVRIDDGSEQLFYIAEGVTYDILVRIYGLKYTRNTNLFGALDGDGKDENSTISEVWLPHPEDKLLKTNSDHKLFEGDFKLYLKYDLDATAYKNSAEYKAKLEEEKQQQAQ